MLKSRRNWGRAWADRVLFPLSTGFRLRSSRLRRSPLLSIFCDAKRKGRDCSHSSKNVRAQVFVTRGDTCLLQVIQRLKHNKERNFLAFSIEDFISSHSYKSLILDSIFNRFLTRIKNFLVAFSGRSKVFSAYCRTY